MILPDNYATQTLEELTHSLEEQGYSTETAEYLAGKVKGTIKDDNKLI